MKFRATILLTVLTATLGLPTLASGQRRVDVSALNLLGVDGKPLSPALDPHKAILLNFWAPWCGPCREEIPWFQAVRMSDPNITVIGVVADPAEYSKAAAFMRSQHVTYQLARLSPQVVRGFGNAEALPETFYLSSKGVIVHAVQGVAPREIMLHYVADAEESSSGTGSSANTALLQHPSAP